MANRCLTSNWFDFETEIDRATLFSLIHRGDLLEINRGSYCHWVVYVGLLPIEKDITEPEDDGLVTHHHMIVHRANPGDQQLGISQSISKGFVTKYSLTCQCQCNLYSVLKFFESYKIYWSILYKPNAM